MKTLKSLSSLILLLMFTNSVLADNYSKSIVSKDPITFVVFTEHETVKAALIEIKTILLKEKFISEYGIRENSFTAKRTTGSEADYYIADVMAEKENDKIKITITLVKVGTGLKSMKKLAKKIKKEIES